MPSITAELVEQHHLIPEEYQKILEILGREPTITELGIFSVMWSEHCSYKSSRVHLKRLPTRGEAVVQGPGENAGIIDIGHGYVCAFKIESHNHPSFVEPFQGAATGVGGILRDIFTMGARPIAIMDSLRFGPIAESGFAGPPGTKPVNAYFNRRILRGVVSGIAHYGNCFGVPTIGGEAVFEPCYQNNPLVNAFALGIAKKDQIFYGRAGGSGNPVIYVGAKTGKDGIHGASLLASSEFSGSDGQQKRPNVQVGDPFLEKLLLEACLKAMQTGAVVGIQDMGAAGLTCSTCEMGGRGGTGIEIELDRVPQRETGMSSYEIMLSESQERMLLVAQRGREEEVYQVFRKWGLDAVEIGTVIDKPVLRVRQHGELVAEIPNDALTEEAPVYNRPIASPQRIVPLDPSVRIHARTGDELAQDLLKLLSAPAIASKRWIYEQYDTMVRTNTAVGPGSDAALLHVKETGQGLAMALDGNGRYCFLDPRRGARLAVAESSRNVSVTGARPLAATNCLNFGNPEKPEIMWQFYEVVEGIREACEALQIPITGGNVSFYNETDGRGIYPTPVLGIVGVLNRVESHVTLTFPEEGLTILLLGKHNISQQDFEIIFGSSQYAQTVLQSIWGLPPDVDLEREKKVQACCRQLIQAGLVRSAHDISDGGLAVAVAECCFGKNVGATIEIAQNENPLQWLFSEDPSQIMVTVHLDQVAETSRIAGQYNLSVAVLGTTGGNSLKISFDRQPLFEVPISLMKNLYESALEAAIEKI
ncbi:MAG: phosphoribosylformylglycinamidine synthase II [Acidobacteria bacterium RIFCSPLOWO2_12_FULL_54_10]|nr:MAG: phosphoribosylformylglycinamidine synthase II [Acidobacteria bacterium RIFCSPLOWO2_12_FULL_54_10]